MNSNPENNGMQENTAPQEQSSVQQETAAGVGTAFGTDGNKYAFPSPFGMSGVGVCSIICALCSFFCVVPAVFGIVMAVVGLLRNRRDVLCYIGLCLSAAFLAYGLVTMIQVCSSPELQALYSGVVSGSEL